MVSSYFIIRIYQRMDLINPLEQTKVSILSEGADNRILVSNLKLKRRAIDKGSIPPLYSNPLIFSSHITCLPPVEEKKYQA